MILRPTTCCFGCLFKSFSFYFKILKGLTLPCRCIICSSTSISTSIFFTLTMNRLRLSTRLSTTTTQQMFRHRPPIQALSIHHSRRYLADIPHHAPVPMDARVPMVFVQKITAIESLDSPWVEEKDPQGQFYAELFLLLLCLISSKFFPLHYHYPHHYFVFFSME